MKINPDYIRAMKYLRAEIDPMDEDFREQTTLIINEFERIFTNLQLEYTYDVESIGWSDIIFMCYMLNTTWRTVNYRYSCNKLKSEYSLPYWLYCYLIEHRDDYNGCLSNTYKFIPDPSDVDEATVEMMKYSRLDSKKSSITEISHSRIKAERLTPEETAEASKYADKGSTLQKIEYNKPLSNTNKTVKAKSNAKVLWISRHILQHGQLEALKEIVGESPTLYQYDYRTDNPIKYVEVAKKLNVDYVFAVLPDEFLITLKVMLQLDNVPVYKQANMKINEDIGIYRVAENGDVLEFRDLTEFNGWVEVKGACLITK